MPFQTGTASNRHSVANTHTGIAATASHSSVNGTVTPGLKDTSQVVDSAGHGDERRSVQSYEVLDQVLIPSDFSVCVPSLERSPLIVGNISVSA